ncbi:MAG: hypothetical protein ACREFI_08330, partial [Stellaceae bacterium]
LEDGAELVMGNRMGALEPGAMSIVSRIGNPLMSRFLNFLFRTPVSDTWCGLRAFRRDALPVLGLRASGMELASEMVIRAARGGLEIRELPIALHPRKGESKLAPFRDGWRSLRLMLVYHPNFLFLVPGFAFAGLGALLMALVFANVPFFGDLVFSHMIGASLLLVVGTQLVGFGLCGRFYAVYQLGDRDPTLEAVTRRIRLEHGLLLGFALMAGGFVLGILVAHHRLAAATDSLTESRMSILAVTLLIVGVQIFFTSFLLSLIGLRRGDSARD